MQPFGVNGMLAFQRPRNFRLQAHTAGSTQADIGSNEQEFWFWFKQEEALYHCSYDDFPRARSLRIPIHPDWIAEALCVKEFGSPEQYRVRTQGDRVEMISQTVSPQGERLQKVTVVALSGPNVGRIVGHRLHNLQGQLVWSAEIKKYQTAPGNHVVPQQVTLRCPAEKMEVDLKLNDCRVNTLMAGRAPDMLFSRPTGYRAIDLARGASATPQSIQRVRGASPQ
jgi:hypothetical protein